MVFFFKQKTAYEMLISDLSSDVCSSDLGYLGNDPSLLEVMNGVRVQQTAQFFYEMARGERRVTGRMAKLVDEFRAEFARILGAAEGMAGIATVQPWVLNEDIRIWFSRHGKCFIGLGPTKARCHELGGTEIGRAHV